MANAKWQQLIFDTSQSRVEVFTEILEVLGADSITYQDAKDQSIFEPKPNQTPLWQSVQITALFDIDDDLNPVVTALKVYMHDDEATNLHIENLPEQNWARVWLKDFKPMVFNKKLWVIPDGFNLVDKNACHIFLDPGLAFGTGTHPTTALCLEWLSDNSIHGKSVIDYGSGSGILSIGAAKLGASRIVAVDIDSQAIRATNDNAHKNQVINIEAILIEDIPNSSLPMVDLLIANILAEPLLALSNTFANAVKPGGQILLSGILTTQSDVIVACYQTHFKLSPVTEKAGWVAIHGVRY